MAISDKEAFRILELPLGVDKDAINHRYHTLTTKLAASKILDDKKKLEKVVQAFHQLLPPSQNKNRHNNLPLGLGGRSSHRANDDAANLSAMHALQLRADKKKAKKKRKKEKRKNNNEKNNTGGAAAAATAPTEENNFLVNNGKIGGGDGESDCSSYEVEGDEELHFNAGFVTEGRKLSNSATATGGGGGNSGGGGAARKVLAEDNKAQMTDEVLLSRQVQARGMAVQGNEAAAQGLHQKAVKLFTQATLYDPTDHRFLGNRSFCFEQLRQYEKALDDADKAIELSENWPKGYFRRGRALLGLMLLPTAEDAFSRVLQLDPDCLEAKEEIRNVRRSRLMEMGFTLTQATHAITKYHHVQPALDALLSGEFHEAIFYSDGEEEDNGGEAVHMLISAASLPPPSHRKAPATTATTTASAAHTAEDVKMNPRNPHGLTSLWVGNVLPEVNEKELQKLFSKYGHVTSVRQLKDKFCAFVNFADSASAGRAMTGLQGHTLNGSRLLIKFPDNPITSTTGAAPAPPGTSGGGGAGGRRRNTGTNSNTNRQGGM